MKLGYLCQVKLCHLDTSGQGIAYLRFKHTERQLSSSLNYFVLKSLQVRVRTTPPNVLSSVKKLKPLLRGSVLPKKSEHSLWGEGINTQTHTHLCLCPKSKVVTLPMVLASCS